MKYLCRCFGVIWVLLCVVSRLRTTGVENTRLTIHCRENNFRLKVGINDNYVGWYKKLEGNSWTPIASAYFDWSYIYPDWEDRAYVRMRNNPADRTNIDSILIMTNVTHPNDSGTYECDYASWNSEQTVQTFTVTVLEVKFSTTSRQLTIEEGDTLNITAEIPDDANAKDMQWIIANGEPRQLGLKLNIEGIRQNQTGTYIFLYALGTDASVEFWEFFYITVTPRQTRTTTTKRTTTTTTRTTKTTRTKPTTNITQPPPNTELTTRHITTFPSTLYQNESVTPSLTTPNISTFPSTPDQNDSVTPALHATEDTDIGTPKLLGSIFGALLAVILLVMLLVLIFSSKGKLPTLCRKKPSPQRATSHNVLVNNVRANSAYSEVADPDHTYYNVDLTNHDVGKSTPDMKGKMSNQDAPDIRKNFQPKKSQKNEYYNLGFATEMGDVRSLEKQSHGNGNQGFDNQKMYENVHGYAYGDVDVFKLDESSNLNSLYARKYTTNIQEDRPEIINASSPNYFLLEKNPSKKGSDDAEFHFVNDVNSMPQGESEAGVYFVLEDNVNGLDSPTISSDKKAPKVANKNKKATYSVVAKKASSKPTGSGKLSSSEVSSTSGHYSNHQENVPMKTVDLTRSNHDGPAPNEYDDLNDYDHLNTRVNKTKESSQTNASEAQYSRIDDTKPQIGDYDKLAIGRDYNPPVLNNTDSQVDDKEEASSDYDRLAFEKMDTSNNGVLQGTTGVGNGYGSLVEHMT